MKREEIHYYEETKLPVAQAFRQLKNELVSRGYRLTNRDPNHVDIKGDIYDKKGRKRLGDYHVSAGSIIAVASSFDSHEGLVLKLVLDGFKLKE